jgi:hypothetical protein
MIIDRQTQQTRSGFFANAQNTLVTGGTFIVSLSCSWVTLVLILWTEC